MISSLARTFLLVAGTFVAACASPSQRPIGVPEDWVELTGARVFVLYAPPGTTYEPQRGKVDSFVGKFRHANFVIDFDYGIYNHKPDEVPAGLVSERLLLDGKEAVIFVERGGIFGYPLRADQTCVGLVTGDIEHPLPIRTGNPTDEPIVLPALTLSMASCTDRQEDLERIKRVYKTIQFHEPL